MIKSYSVKHRQNYKNLLKKARQVAEYAIQHKTKNPSSASVKHIKLPAAIKNQLMRKYGRGNAKTVKNISLIVPNQQTKNKSKTYFSITYEKGYVNIKPLKLIFRWNPGYHFKKINQVEVKNDRYIITITTEESKNEFKYVDSLGVDLNCGVGRHIANAANLQSKMVINLGKCGPNIRKKYFKKRQSGEINGNKESRIMKDIDHKISRAIVNYALKNKLQIVLENLKGIRNSCRKGNGRRKNVNRFVNSWSFYRLQAYISYKSKEHNIPVVFINPEYTSQECSYCGIIGDRNKDIFKCKSKGCVQYGNIKHADINAAFNIAKRASLKGGRATKK